MGKERGGMKEVEFNRREREREREVVRVRKREIERSVWFSEVQYSNGALVESASLNLPFPFAN